MPLKLNVGASKKIADGNYGSRGASVNVEMELDSTLVSEPAKLQDKIRQLFGLVRVSLNEELNGGGNSTKQPAGHTGNGGAPANGGQQGATRRPATQSQCKALHAISRSKQINLSKLLRDRFHVAKPDDLSIKEASQLIDELKHGNGQGGG